MCIRDRNGAAARVAAQHSQNFAAIYSHIPGLKVIAPYSACLLYTSDAADERSSVDLGGRRIIKKKKQQH